MKGYEFEENYRHSCIWKAGDEGFEVGKDTLCEGDVEGCEEGGSFHAEVRVSIYFKICRKRGVYWGTYFLRIPEPIAAFNMAFAPEYGMAVVIFASGPRLSNGSKNFFASSSSPL